MNTKVAVKPTYENKFGVWTQPKCFFYVVFLYDLQKQSYTTEFVGLNKNHHKRSICAVLWHIKNVFWLSIAHKLCDTTHMTYSLSIFHNLYVTICFVCVFFFVRLCIQLQSPAQIFNLMSKLNAGSNNKC